MWSEWATGVLRELALPVGSVNFDSLWAWSNAESGPAVMRWNNPLNTTQPWPGAVAMNSVGVKSYATESDGIQATCVTLSNGYYPGILDHLRRSVPRQQWQDVCNQLGTWGTGCGWLNLDYGPVPGGIMRPELLAHLMYLAGLGRPYVGNEAQWLIDRIKANADDIGGTLGGVLNSAEGSAWARKLAWLRSLSDQQLAAFGAPSADDDSAYVTRAALKTAIGTL